MTRTEATEMVAKGLRISGQTYAHKDAIKAAGCAWDPSTKSWYAPTDEVRQQMQALVDGTFYNGPPPADTTGDESAEALAAKYGRTALAGAKKIEWSVYGLAKGDNGKANGSIRQIKGVRYVQVARTTRRYMSRDFLDDCDLFQAQPGGAYQWTGVAVEPTEEEAAADVAKQQAMDAAAAEKQQQIDDILSGKTPIDAYYHDGEYLSGWSASGPSADLLRKLGMAKYISGWGVHIIHSGLEQLLRERSKS